MDGKIPGFLESLRSSNGRRQVWRYWVIDPLVGAYNTTLHYAMRLLPIDACSNLGAFLSFYSPYIFRSSDQRARRAWCRLRPEEAEAAAVDAAMRRLWRCVSRTMAEYSVIDRFWNAGRISVTGIENMQNARAAGKPLLVAPVHLGNWEVVLVSGIMLGFSGPGIYQRLENRFDMRLAVKTRTRYYAQQEPARPNSLRVALRELQKNGGPFVIYVDEFFRGYVSAPAFGRKLLPRGNIGYVARLAAMTDAALIPAYCVRVGDCARFEVHFLPPIDLVRSGDRDSDTAVNIDRINAAIEPVVLRHLDQWYYLLDLEFGTDN